MTRSLPTVSLPGYQARMRTGIAALWMALIVVASGVFSTVGGCNVAPEIGPDGHHGPPPIEAVSSAPTTDHSTTHEAYDRAAMAYPAEHYATFTDEDSHVDLSRERGEFAPGVDVIYGVNEEEGPRGGKTSVHKIAFDDRLFTADSAREWLDEHDFGDYEDFHEAPRENPDARSTVELDLYRQHRSAFEDGGGQKERATEAVAAALDRSPASAETATYATDHEAVVLAMTPGASEKQALEELFRSGRFGRLVEETEGAGLYRGTRYTVAQSGEPVQVLVSTARQSLLTLASFEPYAKQNHDAAQIRELRRKAAEADRSGSGAVDDVLTDERALSEAVTEQEPSMLDEAAQKVMNSDALSRAAGFAGGIAAAATIGIAAKYAGEARA